MVDLRRRFAALTLASTLGLALLSACVGIPSEGTVNSVPVKADPQAQVPFEYVPPGPAEGAPADRIVAGFLDAMTESPSSGSVARTFLTPYAGARWDPSQATLVYDSAEISVEGTTAALVLRGVIRLAARGNLESQDAPTQVRTVRLGLVRVGNQWRIDSPPQALLLPRRYFEARYVRNYLYYFDPSGRLLVPRTVYVPIGLATPTNLIRALLLPVVGVEREVVRSYVPSAARLEISVPLSQGVARVSIQGGQALSRAEQERLEAQVVWTLRQVPGVNQVVIELNGNPITDSGGVSTAQLVSDPQFAPFLDGGRNLYAVTEQTVAAFEGFDSPLFDTEPRALLRGTDLGWPMGEHPLRSLAVGPPGQTGLPTFYGVSRDGRSLLRLASLVMPQGLSPVPAKIYRGTDLGRPEVDGLGHVWFLDRTDLGAVIRVLVDRELVELAVPQDLELDGSPVLSVSVDGSWLAVSDRDGVAWARIARDPDGIATRLVPVRGLRRSGVADVAWTRNQRLAVLQNRGGRALVELIDPDGGTFGLAAPVQPDPYPRPAVRLLVPATGDRWVLRDRSGQVASLDADGGWRPLRLADAPSFLAYPG